MILSIVGLMYALHPRVAFAFMAASMVDYARLSTVFLVAMVVWSMLLYWLILLTGDNTLQTPLMIFVEVVKINKIWLQSAYLLAKQL